MEKSSVLLYSGYVSDFLNYILILFWKKKLKVPWCLQNSRLAHFQLPGLSENTIRSQGKYRTIGNGYRILQYTALFSYPREDNFQGPGRLTPRALSSHSQLWLQFLFRVCSNIILSLGKAIRNKRPLLLSWRPQIGHPLVRSPCAAHRSYGKVISQAVNSFNAWLGVSYKV